jgi:methyltransferase (TIGR00027 family)
MGSAFIRAAHLRLDPPPWILEDVVAELLLSDRYATAIEAATAEWPPEVFAAFRSHFAARARLAEDVAVDRLTAGQRAYVILGAGADTFAWRHPRAAEFAIWEIDHPASQSWKRAALERANLSEPPNVQFVPADLAQASLSDLELPQRATWNWLGVTQYLDRAATGSTLSAIAATGPGTTAVVEFLLPADLCNELGVAFRAQAIQVAEQAGEPMISFYEPSEVDAVLRGAGFTHVRILDAHAISERYSLGGSRLPLPGAAIFAIATV